MKARINLLMVFLIILVASRICLCQQCSDCICGTAPVPVGFDPNPDSFRGGLFKPAKSNIGGAPQDEDFFSPVSESPVLFRDSDTGKESELIH
jgi:hypothetical protein